MSQPLCPALSKDIATSLQHPLCLVEQPSVDLNACPRLVPRGYQLGGPEDSPAVSYRRLLDVVEEAKHALLEQLRGTFIVVGQAVVGEQVSIAGV